MHLLDLLFPPRADERVIRPVTADTFLALLTPHISTYTRPETITLTPFHNELVRAALHEAKYHGSRHAFHLLATLLSEYLRDADDLSPQIHRKVCLIPIPLSAERLKTRGYNQVEEVLRVSAAELDLGIDGGLLVRTHDTPTQVSLAREKREENMRGAFRATRRTDPALTYLLVDDVITTGATLQAAIDALTTAGAARIIPLALAH